MREPRNCDSDRGGEHRGLEQEQDIQQLRGEEGIDRKGVQKRQQREKSRDRSLHAGV